MKYNYRYVTQYGSRRKITNRSKIRLTAQVRATACVTHTNLEALLWGKTLKRDMLEK